MTCVRLALGAAAGYEQYVRAMGQRDDDCAVGHVRGQLPDSRIEGVWSSRERERDDNRAPGDSAGGGGLFVKFAPLRRRM